MKQRSTRLLCLCLCILLLLPLLSVTATAAASIPALPTTARYKLADSALQLTKDSVQGKASGKGKVFRLSPALAEDSFDLTDYHYLYFWIYIEYADVQKGDGIELASGGKQDKQENATWFTEWSESLQAGWNECLVPLGLFNRQTDGGYTRSAINFLGVVLRSGSAVQTGAISPVYAVKESEITDLSPNCPVTEEIPLETARYQLKNTALQLTTRAFWGTTKKASSYLRLTPTLTGESFDLSEYDYIYTWLYLSATDLAAGDSIELTSGGKQDSKENAVRLKEWSDGQLQVGWNELMIPLDDFKYQTGGGIDYAKLNFIGVVFRSASGAVTGMVSEIYALMTSDFTDTQAGEAEQLTGNGKLGRGELVHDFAQAEAERSGSTLSLTAQLSECVQPGYYTYLCAEIYVENKDLLSRKNASLKISSSELDGVQELAYPISRQSLYEGWNTVFLPIEDFRMSGYDYTDTGYGGLCDLLSICRIGLDWKVRASGEAGTPVVKLGRVFLTNSSVTQPIPTGAYILTDSAMAITTGEVSATVSGGSSQKLVRLMPEINYGTAASVDIRDKQYLYFWLYVSDADADDSTVSDNELELSSGGKCDEQENAIRLYQISSEDEPWLMSGEYGSFASGWNEYVVPIEALTRLTNKSGEDGIGCSYDALNYLRIYFHTKAGLEGEDVTYAISTVWAINPEDLSDEGAGLPQLHPSEKEPWQSLLPVIAAATEATAQSPFADVSRSDWYYDAVLDLTERGLLHGVSESQFAPQTHVSRAMLVTVLHRMEGCPDAQGSAGFTDIPDESWYTQAVRWAAETGLVTGYTDGSFAPDAPITRAELAVILWRLAGSPAAGNALSRYADADTVPAWATDAVAWCVERGILTGVDTQTLAITRTATRAELAVILSRFLYVR